MAYNLNEPTRWISNLKGAMYRPSGIGFADYKAEPSDVGRYEEAYAAYLKSLEGNKNDKWVGAITESIPGLIKLGAALDKGNNDYQVSAISDNVDKEALRRQAYEHVAGQGEAQKRKDFFDAITAGQAREDKNSQFAKTHELEEGKLGLTGRKIEADIANTINETEIKKEVAEEEKRWHDLQAGNAKDKLKVENEIVGGLPKKEFYDRLGKVIGDNYTAINKYPFLINKVASLP